VEQEVAYQGAVASLKHRLAEEMASVDFLGDIARALFVDLLEDIHEVPPEHREEMMHLAAELAICDAMLAWQKTLRKGNGRAARPALEAR
jgi:hypothetical protein